jgi:branched-chain amino acid transport system permease protein
MGTPLNWPQRPLSSSGVIGWVGIGILLMVFPVFVSKFWLYLITFMIIHAMYAVSFNLIMGYGGMISFGHAAFFGIGAYSVALLSVKASLPFWLVLIAAPIFGGLLALMIGFFCLRSHGLYFALLTMVFAEMLYHVVHKWYGFTGGDNGIQGIPLPSFLETQTTYYYFVLVLVVVGIFLFWRIVNSPFGHAVMALRENEERTDFVGINTVRLRLEAFAISGLYAGLCGGLFALLTQQVSPDVMFWTKSAEPIFMGLFGGMYTFFGPIVGAIAIVFLEHFISAHTKYWAIFLGLIILPVVLFLPEGLYGTFERRIKTTIRRGGEI